MFWFCGFQIKPSLGRASKVNKASSPPNTSSICTFAVVTVPNSVSYVTLGDIYIALFGR